MHKLPVIDVQILDHLITVPLANEVDSIRIYVDQEEHHHESFSQVPGGDVAAGNSNNITKIFTDGLQCGVDIAAADAALPGGGPDGAQWDGGKRPYDIQVVDAIEYSEYGIDVGVDRESIPNIITTDEFLQSKVSAKKLARERVDRGTSEA